MAHRSIDGPGTPLVLVPGVQGDGSTCAGDRRAGPLVSRASRSRSAASRAAGASIRRGASTISSDQIDAALDSRGIERAIVCGVSFGGCRRSTLRGRHGRSGRSALVLVSTPGPGWHLRKRHQLYARFPWLFGTGVSRRDAAATAARDRQGHSRPARPAAFRRVAADDGRPRAGRCSRMAKRAETDRAPVDVAARGRARFRRRRSCVSGDPGLDHVVAVDTHVGVRDADSRPRAASRWNGPGHSAASPGPTALPQSSASSWDRCRRRRHHAA